LVVAPKPPTPIPRPAPKESVRPIPRPERRVESTRRRDTSQRREGVRPRTLRCPICDRLVLKSDRVTCGKCNSAFHQICAERMKECPVCSKAKGLRPGTR
jgi:hypothetical protein